MSRFIDLISCHGRFDECVMLCIIDWGEIKIVFIFVISILILSIINVNNIIDVHVFSRLISHHMFIDSDNEKTIDETLQSFELTIIPSILS